MRRHVFNLAAGVSPLLCVATLTMWLRSCWVADDFRVGEREYMQRFVSWRGQIAIECWREYHALPVEFLSRFQATHFDYPPCRRIFAVAQDRRVTTGTSAPCTSQILSKVGSQQRRSESMVASDFARRPPS